MESMGAWPQYCCPKSLNSLVRQGDKLVDEVRHTEYPIIGDIPRFVPLTNYSDAFGLQWNHYRKTQLDSYTGSTVTEERLKRCLGDELWNSLSNKVILEAGCGAGRFTEVLLKRGAKVQSIDLSTAVDANRDNFPISEQHRVAQADILNMPFRSGSFDVVLCLGVIQHTPNPELAIQKLAEQVKPGGCLIIDHYTYSLSHFTKLAGAFRFFLKRMPAEKALRITEGIVHRFLPIHKKVRNFRLGQMLLSRVSPVLCYYRAYPQLSDEIQYEWALLDTHDSLTDYYKHFRTRGQIERTIKKLGLEIQVCTRGGNGIEARAIVPNHLKRMESPEANI